MPPLFIISIQSKRLARAKGAKSYGARNDMLNLFPWREFISIRLYNQSKYCGAKEFS